MLREYGWDTPVQELTWGTTLTEKRFKGKIHIENVEILRVDREVGFKALGTFITFNGKNNVELKWRLARAWQAFCKYSEILCNRGVCIHKRLKMLTLLIHGSLFWCSSSWNLTNVQLDHL